MVTRGLVVVVLPVSVVSVRVVTAVARKERRALVLPASSHPNSVVASDVEVAVVVPLLLHRRMLCRRIKRRETCVRVQDYLDCSGRY